MYRSSSISKRLILVPILGIQLFFLRGVSSLNMTNAYLNHKCFVSQGRYKPGSNYEKDLNEIIKFIPLSTDFSTGYEMMTLGSGPNYVSTILQCRGDSYGPKCRSCYATAFSGLQRRCPRQKGGIIWYDQCLLEISAIDSFGKIDYENNFCMSNAKNEGGDIGKFERSFERSWSVLIDNLTGIATSVKNLKDLYAAGERMYMKRKIYGMVQCTEDISPKGCVECLTFNSLHFQDCLRDKRGARVVGRSCNFRFELYPFVTKTGPKYLKT